MKARTLFEIKNDRNIAAYYWRKALVGHGDLADLRNEDDLRHFRHIQFERWKCKRKLYEIGIRRNLSLGDDLPFFLKRQAE
jgi:hypothetical protein